MKPATFGQARDGQPTVLIAPADDGSSDVCVTLVPPCDGVGHDRCFRTYLEARGYARQLWMQFGWPIVDRACPTEARS